LRQLHFKASTYLGVRQTLQRSGRGTQLGEQDLQDAANIVSGGDESDVAEYGNRRCPCLERRLEEEFGAMDHHRPVVRTKVTVGKRLLRVKYG
jgi:hypothetical protein